MAASVEERIIKMSVIDSGFKSKLKSSLDTLSNFDGKLNGLKGAGLEKITSASNTLKTSLTSMGESLTSAEGNFTLLRATALGAFAQIGASGVALGGRLLKSLTIDPILDGFDEYQTKMKAIAVMRANTNATEKEITGVLAEMNDYADKTNYSFADMTRNIGAFTAAGVGLKDSASSIKGISNLGAVSGSTAVQTSTAMTQLSQAVAAGKLTLQDWNSVTNANMGGKKFQNALVAMYKELNNGEEPLRNAKGEMESFRNSLESGWITSEVLTKTLRKFANDKSMLTAATQAHTLAEAVDNIKESAGSGWATMWEQLIGGAEESTKVWTALAEAGSNLVRIIPDYFARIGTAMRKVGPNGTKPIDDIKNAVTSMGDSIKRILSGPIKILSRVFNDVGNTGESVFTRVIPGALKVMAKSLEFIANLLEPISSFLGDVVVTAIDLVGKLAGVIGKVLGGALGIVVKGFQLIGSLISPLMNQITSFASTIKRSMGGVSTVFSNLGKAFSSFIGVFLPPKVDMSGFFDGVRKSAEKLFEAIKPSVQQWIVKMIENIKDWGKSLVSLSEDLAKNAKAFGEWVKNNENVKKFLNTLKGFVSEVKKMDFFNLFNIPKISADEIGDGEAIENLKNKITGSGPDVANVLERIKTGVFKLGEVLKDPVIGKAAITFGALFLAFQLGKQAMKTMDAFTSTLKSFRKSTIGMMDAIKGVPQSISGLFNTIGTTFKTAGLNAAVIGKLIAWAIVIRSLGIALSEIASLPVERIQAATKSMAVIMGILFVGIGLLTFQLSKMPPTAIAAVSSQMKSLGIALAGFAVAIFALTIAAGVLSGLNPLETAGNLLIVVASVALLGLAASKMSIGPGIAVGIIGISVGLLAMAAAVSVVSRIPMGEMVLTLAALTLVLGALSLSASGLNAGSAVAMVAIAAAVGVLAISLIALSMVPLAALGGALLVLAGGMVILGLAIAGLAFFAPAVAAAGAALLPFGLALSLIGVAIALFAAGMLIASVAFVGFAAAFSAGMIILTDGIGIIGQKITEMGSTFLEGLAGIVLMGAALLLLAIPMAAIAIAAVLVGIAIAAVAIGLGLIAVVAVPAAMALVGFVTILSQLSDAIVNFLVIAAGLMAGLAMIGLGAVALGLGMGVAAIAVALFGVAMIVAGAGLVVFGLSVWAAAASFQQGMVLFNQAMQLIPGIGDSFKNAANSVQEANIGGKAQEEANKAKNALTEAKGGMNMEAFGMGSSTKDGLSQGISGMGDIGSMAGLDAIGGLGSQTGGMNAEGLNMGAASKDGILSGLSGMNGAGSTGGQDAISGLLSQKGGMNSAGTGLGASGKNGITDGMKGTDGTGRKAGNDFASGLGSTRGNAEREGNNVGSSARSGSKTDLYDEGENAGNSFASGLDGSQSYVNRVAASLSSSVIETIRSNLKIGSPSKVTKQIGRWTGEGLSIGMDQRIGQVTNTAERLSNRVIFAMSSIGDVANDALSSSMDMTPRITPVLDDSNISKFNGLQGGSLFAPRASMMGAMAKINGNIASQMEPSVTTNAPQITINQQPGESASSLVSKIKTELWRTGEAL